MDTFLVQSFFPLLFKVRFGYECEDWSGSPTNVRTSVSITWLECEDVVRFAYKCEDVRFDYMAGM